MRSSLVLALAAALSATSLAPAVADPASDLSHVRAAFAAVHSVRAQFSTPKGVMSTIDMVQPNKIRVSAANGMQIVAIGNTEWMGMGGQWRKTSIGAALVQTQMDAARNAGFQQHLMTDYRITDAGGSTVHGVAAHKYHVVRKANGETFDLFVANGLPLEIVMDGGLRQIDYSQYNSVADITPPT